MAGFDTPCPLEIRSTPGTFVSDFIKLGVPENAPYLSEHQSSCCDETEAPEKTISCDSITVSESVTSSSLVLRCKGMFRITVLKPIKENWIFIFPSGRFLS